MSENIKKQDLAKILAKKTGISLKEASNITNEIFDNIVEGLSKDEEVKISNFGTFKVLHKPERIGRNPKTKEPAVIKARKVVSFYSSKKFKDQING